MPTMTQTPDRRQSRYRAGCPACGGNIEAGQWVVKMVSKYGSRPRWKHEDCDNPGEGFIPTKEITVNATVLDGDALLAGELDRLKKENDRLREKLEAAKKKRGKQPLPKDVTLPDVAHPALEEVLELLAAGEHVMLVGPAGSGKTYLAGQAAAAMGLEFSAISCTAGMSESQLLGRMLPRGEQGQFEFVGTEFLARYEKGGVFLFDEFDAADPNVCLVLNNALANGHMGLPSRTEPPTATRHKDFNAIAACNTFGRGADRQYVGRNQLDESTLDRFRIGTVEIDYDRQLEERLWEVHRPDDLGVGTDVALQMLWEIRQRVRDAKLERCVSTRFIISAAKALERGRSMEYVLDKLFAGWRKDEVVKAKGGTL